MSRVEVWRGATIESVHQVSIAVVDAQGRLRASTGNPELVAFARSAVKPIQALPLVRDGVTTHFGFDARELAVCCASHSGEERHVECVRGLLRRIGVEESALACGAHPPHYAPAARALQQAGQPFGRVHNNCSGKHTGMLALACRHGWPIAGYQRPEHPVQRRILEEICEWTELTPDEIATGVDGCGVVTFALPLSRLAGAFGRLAGAARRGETAASAVVGAMMSFPQYVAGTGRLCTLLMRAADGRVMAKAGAEGVYCVAVPGAELGIALKVEDGAARAAEPAILAVLRALSLLSDDEMAELAAFAEPSIGNTRGETVGRIRAAIQLEPHG